MDHLRYITPTIGTIFAGGTMSQTFGALYWFERLFQEKLFSQLLELGTGHGALTLFFGLHFPDRVVTIDKLLGSINNEVRADLFRRLGIKFLQDDLLAPGVIQELVKAMRRPLLVFCDNGNKKVEFLEAAPQLQPGDSIIAHDVNVEFHPNDPEIAACIERLGLVPWEHNQEALDDQTRLSCWHKV